MSNHAPVFLPPAGGSLDGLSFNREFESISWAFAAGREGPRGRGSTLATASGVVARTRSRGVVRGQEGSVPWPGRTYGGTGATPITRPCRRAATPNSRRASSRPRRRRSLPGRGSLRSRRRLASGPPTLPLPPCRTRLTPGAGPNASGCGIPLVSTLPASPPQGSRGVHVDIRQTLTTVAAGYLTHHLDREPLPARGVFQSAPPTPGAAGNIVGPRVPAVTVLALERQRRGCTEIFSGMALASVVSGNPMEFREQLLVAITGVHGGDVDRATRGSAWHLHACGPARPEDHAMQFCDRSLRHQLRDLD